MDMFIEGWKVEIILLDSSYFHSNLGSFAEIWAGYESRKE